MSAGTAVRRAARSDGFEVVARWGLTAHALVWLLVGVLAVFIAQGDGEKHADHQGAFAEVARHSGGRLVLGALTAGLAAYALWRLSQVFREDGLGSRIKSLFRFAVYAALAVNSTHLLLSASGDSSDEKRRILVVELMRHTAGRWLVGAVGVAILVTGLVMAVRAILGKFREHLELPRMSKRAERAVTVLGVVGRTARGLVIAAVGAFLARAALEYDPNEARDLDGTLRALAETSAGPIVLYLAATGLIVYGIYGLAEARWRRT